MALFNSAVGALQTLAIVIDAGLDVRGAVSLTGGYSNDNPGANAHVR